MGQEQSSSCTQVLPFAKSQFLFLTLDKYANINIYGFISQIVFHV